MAAINESIKIRRKKKPLFVSRDAHKNRKVRVPFKWRKPRGKHSPIRQKHKGKPKMVSIGYGSPKEVKGLHNSGVLPVIVHNKKQLESINPEKQGIIFSRSIGSKKKIEFIKFALEKKLPIINLKDPQKLIEKLESQFKKRKESKKRKISEKGKKEQEKKKKAEEKAKEEEKEGDKEKGKTIEGVKEEKEEEKKEQEKTIIKKQ
jgi:large subunit ribosomal protein L32e